MSRQRLLKARRQAELYRRDREQGCPVAGCREHRPEPREEQLSLDASRLSRRTDPASSARAARDLVSSGAWRSQKQQVMAALDEFDGSTTLELAQLAGLDRYVVARRMGDLERDGLVKRLESFDGSDTRWYCKRRVREVRSEKLCS